MLKSIKQPDASLLQFAHDDAHRLTEISDNTGNHIQYTLDGMGNRIKEEVKDPQGNLVRSHRRIYDALGRLQNLITPQ